MLRGLSLFLKITIHALLLVLCLSQAEAAGNRNVEEPYILLDLAETEKIWGQPPKNVDEQIQRREEAQAVYSKYDGKRVVIDGEYNWGFEISSIGDIWIDFQENPDRKLLNAVSQLEKRAKVTFKGRPFLELNTCRVRLFGAFECKKGEMYGHLGGWHALLLVERLEILPDEATASRNTGLHKLPAKPSGTTP